MADTPTYTERRLPHTPDPGQTHYEGCWQEPGHHNCAVVEVRHLRERVEDLEGALHREDRSDEAPEGDPYGGEEACPNINCGRGWGHEGPCDAPPPVEEGERGEGAEDFLRTIGAHVNDAIAGRISADHAIGEIGSELDDYRARQARQEDDDDDSR